MSQKDVGFLKNSIQFNQSIFNYGGDKFFDCDLNSNDLSYTRFFKNLGFGLGINRIQLLKQGLEPLGPLDEVYRRDNLQLYYSQILISYRFMNLCASKNLKVCIDFAPSLLIGGRNKYYALIEGGGDSLMSNSYWKNPTQMEYETKCNIYGRLGVSYVFFKYYEFGINVNTYLRFIAPTLMQFPRPFLHYPSQINKSSYLSISIKYNY